MTTATCTTASIHGKIKELNQQHAENANQLRARIEELEAKIAAIPPTMRWRMQERMSLVRALAVARRQVEDEATLHQSGMADAMELLEKRRNRKRKWSAHVNELDRLGSAPPGDNTIAYTTCQKCGHMLEKIVDASVMICPSCGVSEDYLESTRDGLSFNEDVEFVSNTYKRQNHLQEWINQVQGRETAPIPGHVIHKVIEQLYKSGIRQAKDIRHADVRAALKALKFRKYYKNLTSIIDQLTGVKPRRLLNYEEDIIKTMFCVMQKPFEKHRPSDRRNFLSYSYILYKLCELRGMTWIRSYFKLLKGDDKLHKQDEVWKLICADFHWKYIPSI